MLESIAIGILKPDGEFISIPKIKDFEYHINYFEKLSKENTFVKNTLIAIDFPYFYENPTKVYEKIVPLFQMNGCVVLINLAPNIVYPTNAFLVFLTNLTDKQKEYINSIYDNLKELEFFGVSLLNDDTFINEELNPGVIMNIEEIEYLIKNEKRGI